MPLPLLLALWPKRPFAQLDDSLWDLLSVQLPKQRRGDSRVGIPPPSVQDVVPHAPPFTRNCFGNVASGSCSHCVPRPGLLTDWNSFRSEQAPTARMAASPATPASILPCTCQNQL